MKRVLLGVLGLSLIVSLLAGCAGTRCTAKWVDSPGTYDEANNKHFTGVSYNFYTEREARGNAREDAADQILVFMGVFKKIERAEGRVTEGQTSDVLGATISAEVASRQLAQSFIQGIHGIKYCTEYREITDPYGDKKRQWKAYVFVPFDRRETDKALLAMVGEGQREELMRRARNHVDRIWKDFNSGQSEKGE